mmetsp:Transcript_68164/g.186817  ORF Transcript_68164/g.186817 Transcript_68164/m.186817 type:complete len:243 (+) Transcript_68164:857-1585(+)
MRRRADALHLVHDAVLVPRAGGGRGQAAGLALLQGRRLVPGGCQGQLARERWAADGGCVRGVLHACRRDDGHGSGRHAQQPQQRQARRVCAPAGQGGQRSAHLLPGGQRQSHALVCRRVLVPRQEGRARQVAGLALCARPRAGARAGAVHLAGRRRREVAPGAQRQVRRDRRAHHRGPRRARQRPAQGQDGRVPYDRCDRGQRQACLRKGPVGVAHGLGVQRLLVRGQEGRAGQAGGLDAGA